MGYPGDQGRGAPYTPSSDADPPHYGEYSSGVEEEDRWELQPRWQSAPSPQDTGGVEHDSATDEDEDWAQRYQPGWGDAVWRPSSPGEAAGPQSPAFGWEQAPQHTAAGDEHPANPSHPAYQDRYPQRPYRHEDHQAPPVPEADRWAGDAPWQRWEHSEPAEPAQTPGTELEPYAADPPVFRQPAWQGQDEQESSSLDDFDIDRFLQSRLDQARSHLAEIGEEYDTDSEPGYDAARWTPDSASEEDRLSWSDPAARQPEPYEHEQYHQPFERAHDEAPEAPGAYAPGYGWNNEPPEAAPAAAEPRWDDSAPAAAAPPAITPKWQPTWQSADGTEVTEHPAAETAWHEEAAPAPSWDRPAEPAAQPAEGGDWGGPDPNYVGGRDFSNRPAAGTGRRGGRALALIGTGVVVAAVSVGAFVMIGGSGGKHHATASRSMPQSAPAGSTRPSASATPDLANGGKIAERTTDPTPLTLAEVFTAKSFTVSGRSYTMTTTKLDTTCSSAVHGTAMESALKSAQCTQFLRASFETTDGKLIGTIGIANLDTMADANTAAQAAGKTAYMTPLPGSGDTKNLGNGDGVGGPLVRGHYLIMAWTQNPEGTDPTTSQRTAFSQFSEDVMDGSGLFHALGTRAVTGQPPQG